METFALGLGPKIFAICREKVYTISSFILISLESMIENFYNKLLKNYNIIYFLNFFIS